jgi:hypothetical protein
LELLEEPVPAEAGVTLPSVGVQDPEGRSPSRWPGPVAGDDHLRSLADDVPAEPDPRSTGELEPDAGRLTNGGGQPPGPAARRSAHIRPAVDRARGLEHDEGDPCPPRQGRQAPESIGECAARYARALLGTAGQVDDQQVDRSTGQQRAGDRQALLGVGRGQHDQPLRLDPPGHDLDRVQGSGKVQPGDDRAGRLGFRREPQGERRPAARQVTPQRHAHPSGHAVRAEDGIELGETGREDAVGIGLGLRQTGALRQVSRFERHRGQRPDDLAGISGRRCSPARAQGRQGRVEVRGGSGHRRLSGHRWLSIEQMFE